MAKKVLGLKVDTDLYYRAKVLFWNLGFRALWYDVYHLSHWVLGIPRDKAHPSLNGDTEILIFGGRYFSSRHFAYIDAKRDAIHWENIKSNDGQTIGLPGIIERFLEKQLQELHKSC